MSKKTKVVLNMLSACVLAVASGIGNKLIAQDHGTWASVIWLVITSAVISYLWHQADKSVWGEK